ncbi:MAG: hypothetical protein WCK37_04750 [Candidatus Falkowbacteria bacterium]
MNKNNFLIYAPKVLLIIAWEIVYFPLWWYSAGFGRMAMGVFGAIKRKFISLALGVWLKNLFVPMYGQHDFAGRCISFFMRFFQIIFRGIAFLFYTCFSLLLIIFWLILPPLVIYLIYLELNLK